LVSTPVTERANLPDFIDDGSSTRKTIAFDPQNWKEYDMAVLLRS
jgi:hypothetical protein